LNRVTFIVELTGPCHGSGSWSPAKLVKVRLVVDKVALAQGLC